MKATIFILLLISPLSCLAQKMDDLHKFENLFESDNHDYKWGKELRNSKNEISFIFSAAFVLYKEILSSQDVDACVFTPSCSVYAIESIKEEGVIKGFFNAVDRLTRCNPGPKRDMPVDVSTGKYFDPVNAGSSINTGADLSPSSSSDIIR